MYSNSLSIYIYITFSLSIQKDELFVTSIGCTDPRHNTGPELLRATLRPHPGSCIITRGPRDLHPHPGLRGTGLTHQATADRDSGIWHVLFSRLIIIGCSKSWASTVTTGLALQGEDTGSQGAT